jgi:hypothetical protein
MRLSAKPATARASEPPEAAPENARPRRTARQHLLGALRVSLLALPLMAAAMLFLQHRAHAYGEAVLERFGQHMLRYADANHQYEPSELRLNGAKFFISTGNIRNKTVKNVMDHFHVKCQGRNGRFQERWSELAEQRDVRLPRFGMGLLDGVFREGNDEAGIIACIETGQERLAPEQMMSRVKEAIHTGDMSRVGDMRYVYIRKDVRRTAFVAMWSEGPLNLKQMFPKQGDVPGNDPPGLPRPPGTRRVLSGYPLSVEASLNMYNSSSQNATQLLEFYHRELPRAGFVVDTKPHERFLAAHDRKRSITISLSDDARTGHSVASVATQAD